MHKKIAISRVFVCVLLLLLTASLVVSFVAPSLAYFQTVFTSTGINSAKVELIFDRLDFTKFTAQQLTEFGLDEDAEWGTKANPYVISEKYHVQNLSVLQNNGFFKERVQKDENGEPVLDDNDQPIPLQSFFLVCNTDGTPVAINCEGMTMAPIGTHENPFTGVIDGAFATSADEVTYTYTPRSSSDTVSEKSYGVSVSTIGNLIVKASTSEPDIGFFGCVGYHGTVTVDETGANPPQISDGYAASIQNLLLADVTVSSVPTLKDSLAAWWAEVKATMQVEEGKEAPEHRHEDFESHHIGVVAGHAEFATINNVSVFYTQGVQTFQISGSSYINYYSTTGLIGMLHYVNPTITSSGVLVGDGNSVSDGDMVEGGLGGGGTISGTLTGYMLAETLFTEHEKYIAVENREDIYDVKDMKDRNGEPLFSTVSMKEGSVFSNTNVTYYYFSDSVFTFTMSASSKSSASHIDYVQKIWDLSDGNSRPSVSATKESDEWKYTLDEGAKKRYAYRLTAVTDDDIAAFNRGDGGYYVIAYHDKGPTNSQVDDVLYVLSSLYTDTPSGTAFPFPVNEFCEKDTVKTEWNGFEIAAVSLPSTNSLLFNNAFLNVSGRTLSDPVNTDYALALYSQRTGFFVGTADYPHPVAPIMSSKKDISTDGEGWQTAEAMVLNWQLERDPGDSGKVAVYATYSFWGANHHTSGAMAVGFNGTKFTYPVLAAKELGDNETLEYSLANSYLFNIYKVTVNTQSNGATQIAPENFEIEAKSMKPSGEPLYNFDPSKYAFKNVIGADGNPTGKYTLAPIASYNLNTGKGTLLTELNHVVKLYQATTYNHQLKLSNTFLGGILGDWADTNSGGVVEVQVGVTDPPVYATIPSGMLAFNIMEATEQKPSYINIIVAINPEQLDPCTIGLWYMDNEAWNSEFDIDSPDQSFALPVSHYAVSQTGDRYIIPVTQFTPNEKDSSGKYTPQTGDSYVYLNGSVAFVYHTFEVQTPGIYFVGSGNGPMSVSYFSVSGAAGQGADGTSTSPLGDIDFVYENDGDIITIDKKFDGVQDTANEDYSYYYPSYHFVVMKRDGTDSDHPSVQTENIWVYRYIDPDDTTSPKRYISITGCDDAENKGLTDLYQDSSPPA